MLLAKDAAVLEAGLDVSAGAAGKLGLGYSGQLSSDNRDHAMTVSFSPLSSSKPMKLRLVCLQATAVVPLPIVKSSTSSPSFV